MPIADFYIFFTSPYGLVLPEQKKKTKFKNLSSPWMYKVLKKLTKRKKIVRQISGKQKPQSFPNRIANGKEKISNQKTIKFNEFFV